MLKEQYIMPRSKEIQEQMRNKIVVMYHSGKRYKAISKFNGYIILNSNYYWDTLILASGQFFACAVSAAERDEEERVV